MRRRNGLRGTGTVLSLMVGLAIVGSPGLAHQVKVAEDVGGTLHVEPNDVARAGEPAQVWFALTHRGGAVVPLADCDCHLQIYREPHAEGDAPLLEPELVPVSAAGYSQIPGTTVVFPEVGAYVLQLEGRPTTPEAFAPFVLPFELTVAAGQQSTTTAPTPATVAPTATPSALAQTEPEPATARASHAGTRLVLIAVGSLVLLGAMLWGLRHRLHP